VVYTVDNETRQMVENGNWITMSNALTRSAHNLTLAEKRIVMLAVSRIDSRKQYKLHEVPKTKITASEFAETFDVDMNTAYDQLRSASKKLFLRYITFFTAAEKRKGKELSKTVTQMHWVGQIKYHDGEGWVELHWWPELFLNHLSAIQKQFTSLQLKQATALRSKHSWKLLELLMRFKDKGYAYYTIEDFQESMEATKIQRDNFAKTRIQLIEPAVAELIQKDGWLISWEPEKAGRRVKGIKFRFARNPQGSLDI
jgi:plasmid replication initiation protein